MDLIRFRPYQLSDVQVAPCLTPIFPVPSVEEFTIGRRTGSASTTKVDEDPGAPWDLAALQLLAKRGNDATLTMLDLCAAEEAEP